MFEPNAYSIEEAVFSGRFSRLRKMPEGMTVADQRAIVQKIYDRIPTFFLTDEMPKVERHGGRLSINSWARPREHRIVMGALAGPAMVCHEVAHLIAPPKSETGAWHSQLWEHAYVMCVEIAIGSYHAQRLAKAFTKARKPSSSRAAGRGVR